MELRTVDAQLDVHTRRNRAERLVRSRLSDVEDVDVQASSWQRVGDRAEAFVAVIARQDDARRRAHELLRDVSGLSTDQWQCDWIPLDLGDWMIRVFPERAL